MKKIIIFVVILFIAGGIFLFRQAGQKADTQELSQHQAMQTDLADLPLKTYKGRIERLPFIKKDGVKEFHLSIDEIRWEYADGKFVHAWGYNGQIPGPEIRVVEGDKVRVVVKNNLLYEKGTTIHWHGVLLSENKADGVPGLDQYPIKPGETFVYEFTAVNAGTHFYHTHGSSHVDVALQDDMGLSGALIIEPRSYSDERHPANYDREYVYLLDEWAVSDDGSNHALHLVGASGEHVHQEANVFTINGRIFPDNLEDGKLLVHPMHTHGHAFELLAVDGNLVPRAARQMMDVITLNPGERRDIVIRANNPGVWLFHCHNVHHAASGMILAFFYEGYEPCCLDAKEPEEVMQMMEGEEQEHMEGGEDGHTHE
jgi:manganese oxidase